MNLEEFKTTTKAKLEAEQILNQPLTAPLIKDDVDKARFAEWKDLKDEQRMYGHDYVPKYKRIRVCPVPSCWSELEEVNVGSTTNEFGTEKYAILQCSNCGYKFAESTLEPNLSSSTTSSTYNFDLVREVD